MSEVVGEGVIRIRTDESGVDVDGAGKRAGDGYSKGFSSGIKGIAAAIGGVLVAGKALDFVKSSIADAREQQKIDQASAAIIKATGSAANLTAQEVNELAAAQERKTGADGAAIQRGANLLLTFKNVKKEGEGLNDVFGRATEAGLDLAAAGFGSVEGNALQLGKALNDPLKGISALSRSGVTFTAQQKEQIEGFVAQNDLLSAQKIILGEVEKQVGGTAAATADQGAIATAAFGEIKEEVGNLLLPILDRLYSTFTTRIAPAIKDLLQGVGPIAGVFRQVGDAVSAVFSAGNSAAAGGIFDTIREVVASVLPQLQSAFTQLAPVAQQVFGSVRDAVVELAPVMQDTFVNKVLPAVRSLIDYVVTNVVPVFVQFAKIVATQVVPLILELATYFYGTLYPAVVDIVTVVATKLKPVFDQLVDTFQTRILPTFQRVIEQVRTQLIPALIPIVNVVVKVIGFLAKLAATILGVLLPPLVRIAGFIFSRVVPAIVSIVTKVAEFIGFIGRLAGAIGGALGSLAGFQNALTGLVRRGLDAVVNAVRELPDKVRELGGKLFQAGKSAIGRLLDGFKGAGGLVSDIAGNVWDTLRGLINSAIRAINDALEFSIDIPGPNININLPNIPQLAKGTDYFPGGVAWVGEEGPELVRMPRGSQVIPARESADLARPRVPGLGGGGLSVGTLIVQPHNYSEFERQMLERARLAGLGGRPPVGASA